MYDYIANHTRLICNKKKKKEKKRKEKKRIIKEIKEIKEGKEYKKEMTKDKAAKIITKE